MSDPHGSSQPAAEDDGIPAPNPLPGDGDPQQRDDVDAITPGEGPGGAMQATPGVPDLTEVAARTGTSVGGGASGALPEGGPTQQGEGETPAPPGTPAAHPEGVGGPGQGGASHAADGQRQDHDG